MTCSRRFVGRLLLLLVAVGALGIFGSSASEAAPGSPPQADGLMYTIRTRYGGGTSCTTERYTTGVIGVPAMVDVGGLPLPDLAVELIVVPPLPGITDTTTLNVLVTKLAVGPLPVLIEVVLAPSGAANLDRVAFGYDACAATAPLLFRATVVSQPTRLSIEAGVISPGANLTLLGSSFRQVGMERATPTAVSARLQPVPSTLTAVVDELGGDRYQANVTTNRPTKLTLGYRNVTTTAGTTVDATVDQFPGAMTVTIGPDAVAYTASAPIRAASVNVTTTTDGRWTDRITANLVDLPRAASFRKDGEAHATIEAQGRLGDATVRIASHQPGVTVPAPASRPNQYLVSVERDTYEVVDARIRGLARAVVGWDDPIAVDLDHTAGPFDVDVSTDDAHTTAAVRDLPAVVQLNYSPETQALTYAGSGVIGQLTIDHTGDAPLVETATDAHVLVQGIPLGFSLTFDEEASSMTATTSGGSLGLLQVQLTSGPDERLPAGVIGVKLVDRMQPDTYTVFVRLAGIAHANLGWGDPVRVDLHHAGGPFIVSTLTQNEHNDVSINTKTVEARIEDLPAEIDLAYSSAAHTVTYIGSAVIDRIQVDVENTQDAVAKRATELHLLALDLPTQLNLSFDFGDDNQSFSANLPGDQTIGLLELQLTSGPDHRLEPAGSDGLLLEDLDNDYVLFARAHELQGLHYEKTISPTSGEGTRTVTTIDATLLGGRDLRLDLRESDETKPDGQAVFQATYEGPPESMLLFLIDTTDSDGDDWHTQIVYSAPEQGESLQLHTNQGESRSFMDVSLEPVPTVASACISGGTDFCSDFATGSNLDDQSFSVFVAQPTRVEMLDCKEGDDDPEVFANCAEPFPSPYGGTLLELKLTITRSFTILTEEVHFNNDLNGVHVHFDTGGEEVHGSIVKESISNSGPNGLDIDEDLEVFLRPGFLAEDRRGVVACEAFDAGDPLPNCVIEDSAGKMTCPDGTKFEATLGLNFEEEICPAPRVDDISPASLPQGASMQEVILAGTNFSPGASVVFLAASGFIDDTITVHSVTWLDIDHVRLVVSVADDSPTGSRDMFVKNPVHGEVNNTTCSDCFTVT